MAQALPPARSTTSPSTGDIENASVFMHELGHTLDLRHGGGDNVNCKPNYLSVMNYEQQTKSSAITGAYPLDFSRKALPTLVEAGGLNEPAGVGGAPGRTSVYSVNGQPRGAPADGPIDWNGNYPDTAHDAGPILPEPTHADFVAVVDDEADGVPNASDNCPTLSNGNQDDRDADGVGDTCDPDSDPPTVTVTAPSNGATNLLRKHVDAACTCADEPGGSGVATCVGDVDSGEPLDTSTVGLHTFTVRTTDRAGHARSVTANFNVQFVFLGFLPPVDNLGVLNIAKAGQGIHTAAFSFTR